MTMSMKRENKINLIFIIVLIAAMIPGLTILIRRKLSGQGASAVMPDVPPFAVAYNQPPPYPPGLQRIEPLAVREWVRSVVRDKIGKEIPLLSNSQGAIVSDAFFTQAVAVVQQPNNGTDLWLLIWRDAPPPSKTDPAVGRTGGDDAAVQSLTAIDVPLDVRHALQDVGYIDPPKHAWLGCYRFAGDQPPKDITLAHRTGRPVTELLHLQ